MENVKKQSTKYMNILHQLISFPEMIDSFIVFILFKKCNFVFDPNCMTENQYHVLIHWKNCVRYKTTQKSSFWQSILCKSVATNLVLCSVAKVICSCWENMYC